MHELLTPNEMARADSLTIARGIPGITLMRSAGRAVAEVAALHAPDKAGILIVAGTGNNGGDGFVAAEHLRRHGRDVTVALFGEKERLKANATTALAEWTGDTIRATPETILGFDFIVDALLGAGLDRDVKGAAASLIEAINGTGKPVLAVDLPSGIDGATGKVRGVAIEATETVTFFRLKPGHLLYPGRGHCGTTTLADIGIEASVLEDIRPKTACNDPALWQRHYPVPTVAGHKYDRGHALVVSGPVSRTGAARLAAGAALRIGAGLVTLASPDDALAVNAAHLTAVMLKICNDAEDLASILNDKRLNAVALGPGLGMGEATRDLVLACLRSDAACVLDADAITVFSDDPAALFDAIAERSAPVVLTPHGGEFGRLFPQEKDLPKLDAALAASAKSGAVVVLKGADTVIAAPDGHAAINANAPPWLATAGAGDTLAGIVTGLLAQRMPAYEAAAAGVWMHGEAGREAGPGLIAEDLSPALKPVIARMTDALSTEKRNDR